MSSTLLFAGGGTGGHVFPLIAVAEVIKALAPNLELVFVGTERGLETRVVPERGYSLELLPVAPIRGSGVGGAFRGLGSAVQTLPLARALIARRRPHAVLCVGGYAAGPVSLVARLRGVPLALLEPNSVMGLTNRLIAPLSQRAYTAFEATERYFRKGVVLRTGVPIRAGFAPAPYGLTSAGLRVLLLGGSQGAKALNEIVPKALAKTGVVRSILHQSGGAHESETRALYASLGLAERAWVVPFIEDMAAAIADADLVIGRAGASTLSEIAAVGRPSLLIPYPHAAGDHQLYNARALAEAGASVCLPQTEASVERTVAELERLAERPEHLAQMAKNARAWGRPQAAAVVAEDLLRLSGLLSAPPSPAEPVNVRGPGPNLPKISPPEGL